MDRLHRQFASVVRHLVHPLLNGAVRGFQLPTTHRLFRNTSVRVAMIRMNFRLQRMFGRRAAILASTIATGQQFSHERPLFWGFRHYRFDFPVTRHTHFRTLCRPTNNVNTRIPIVRRHRLFVELICYGNQPFYRGVRINVNRRHNGLGGTVTLKVRANRLGVSPGRIIFVNARTVFRPFAIAVLVRGYICREYFTRRKQPKIYAVRWGWALREPTTPHRHRSPTSSWGIWKRTQLQQRSI